MKNYFGSRKWITFLSIVSVTHFGAKNSLPATLRVLHIYSSGGIYFWFCDGFQLQNYFEPMKNFIVRDIYQDKNLCSDFDVFYVIVYKFVSSNLRNGEMGSYNKDLLGDVPEDHKEKTDQAQDC